MGVQELSETIVFLVPQPTNSIPRWTQAGPHEAGIRAKVSGIGHHVSLFDRQLILLVQHLFSAKDSQYDRESMHSFADIFVVLVWMANQSPPYKAVHS